MRIGLPCRYVFFPDYDKIEAWVNEKSSRGLQLVRIGWWGYHFEIGEVNEYIYRLDVLRSSRKSTDSQNYLRFLQDTGIEIVPCKGMWGRSVWLKRKPINGNFDLYSDIETKIEYYRRLSKMAKTSILLITAAVLFEWVFKLQLNDWDLTTLPYLFGIFVMISLTCTYINIKTKIRRLKKEVMVRE